MGENGAGKSTLLRILAGLMPPDSGEVRLNGETCRFRSPDDAIRRGVAMIHQELMPFLEMSVDENIYAGREPTKGVPGWIDRPRMEADSQAVLASLGVEIEPRRPMRTLSVPELQVVEIAKAVARNASLVIMDEPTSALSHRETEALFRMVERLKAQGTAIIYVSHKLDEIFRIGDRVTVLRDGRSVGTDRVSDLDEATLISRMVGRTLGARHRPEAPPAGTEVLAVEHLSRDGYFDDVSFRLRRGEILGFAGLMGAGRTEVMSALYGLAPADEGTIHVHGKKASIRSPREAIDLGIGFVSEDRKRIGLVLSASVAHNVTLGNLRRCCRAAFIDPTREEIAAENGIRRFGIKTASRDQAAGLLSGGNQQKVVMAKVLFADPEILILDEPTRGIDIGAKQEIYRLIESWAREGLAILLVSSELPEILALSDRVIVMAAGRVVAELPGAGLSQEMILKYEMPN